MLFSFLSSGAVMNMMKYNEKNSDAEAWYFPAKEGDQKGFLDVKFAWFFGADLAADTFTREIWAIAIFFSTTVGQ